MSNRDEQVFLDAYVGLMAAVWADPAVAERLEADPTGYARSAGLPVADGARVVLDRTAADGLLGKDFLVAEWTRDPSAPVLHVPVSGPIDAAELSDQELEQVAGGLCVRACIIIE